jgi:hypothetical protein
MRPTRSQRLKKIHEEHEQIARETPQTESQLVRRLMYANGMTEAEVRATSNSSLTEFGRLVYRAYPDNKYYFRLVFTFGVKIGFAPEGRYGGIPSLSSIHTLYYKLKRESKAQTKKASVDLYYAVDSWLDANAQDIDYMLVKTTLSSSSGKIVTHGLLKPMIIALCDQLNEAFPQGVFSVVLSTIYFDASEGRGRMATKKKSEEEVEEEALELLADNVPSLPIPSSLKSDLKKDIVGNKNLVSEGVIHTWQPLKVKVVKDTWFILLNGTPEEKAAFKEGFLSPPIERNEMVRVLEKMDAQLALKIKEMQGLQQSEKELRIKRAHRAGELLRGLLQASGMIAFIAFLGLYFTGNPYAVGVVGGVSGGLTFIFKSIFMAVKGITSPFIIYLLASTLYIPFSKTLGYREGTLNMLRDLKDKLKTNTFGLMHYLSDKFKMFTGGIVTLVGNLYERVVRKFRRASYC